MFSGKLLVDELVVKATLFPGLIREFHIVGSIGLVNKHATYAVRPTSLKMTKTHAKFVRRRIFKGQNSSSRRHPLRDF